MHQSLSRYFDIPVSDEMRSALYDFIEITDLMFTLSIIEFGEISPAMPAEVKRVGVACLETYR